MALGLNIAGRWVVAVRVLGAGLVALTRVAMRGWQDARVGLVVRRVRHDRLRGRQLGLIDCISVADGGAFHT